MELKAVQMPASSSVNAAMDRLVGGGRGATKADAAGSSSFASLIAQSLERVNGAQASAESLSHQYQLGQNDVSLEDAMISLQKANIGFQTTVQVRNKLVAAYNDIMNMPL